MTAHSRYYTRFELTCLDQYAKGMKVPAIALQLGRSESGVWRMLRMLHITNPKTARQPYAKPLPDDSPLRCQTCGILLAEAAKDDVPYYEADCRYCALLKQGVSLYAPLPLPGGDAPELRVFEMFGMAAGRDY